MYVSAFAPGAATGLTPTVRIRDLSDNSLAVTDAAMAEVGDGGYKYDFAAAVPSKQYQMRVDWGAALGLDRYGYGDFTSYALETTAQAIPGAVWDEPLTGATHNVATSAGRRLRQVTADIITTDLAQGPGTGNAQIVLAASASSVDGAYDPALISIVNGTGAGQSRLILQYVGASRLAVVDRSWKTLPDATSEYVVQAHPNLASVNEGLLRAGGANTARLNASASAVNGSYVGQLLWLRGGTGEDQTGVIIAYDGATQTATIAGNWAVQPSTDTAYMVIPTSPVLLAATVHTGAVIPRVSTVTDAIAAANA